MFIKARKAQSTLEYAALVAVIVGAIIAVNAYMKRSIQGQLRAASDDIGNQYDYDTGGYHYISDLTGNETTRSVFGAGNVTITGLGFTPGQVTAGKGSEIQWTDTTATRKIDEQITTDTAANINATAD